MKLTEREIRLLLEGVLSLHESNSEVAKLTQRLRDELARLAHKAEEQRADDEYFRSGTRHPGQ